MRAAAMTEADTVFVIGRKLDYQLGYGSPAVFPNAKFIRLADTPGELIDNRRGEPEILATPALALDAIVAAAGNRKSAVDRAWVGRAAEAASRPQRQGRATLHDRIGRRRRSARHLSGPASTRSSPTTSPSPTAATS